MLYTSYAVKVIDCNVHSMKSGETLAAPAALLLMALPEPPPSVDGGKKGGWQ